MRHIPVTGLRQAHHQRFGAGMGRTGSLGDDRLLSMNRRNFLTAVATSTIASEAAPDALEISLLGQALIRHDLRKESPVSFERMKDFLSRSPAVFTNFEAAVQISLDVRAASSGLVHNAEPDTLDCLRALGVNLLALSSNHAGDLGPAGVMATIREAERRGMITAGTGSDIVAAARPGVLRTRQGTIAMVGFVSARSVDDATIAGPNRPGVLPLRARADGGSQRIASWYSLRFAQRRSKRIGCSPITITTNMTKRTHSRFRAAKKRLLVCV